jgi:hypothetical protein
VTRRGCQRRRLGRREHALIRRLTRQLLARSGEGFILALEIFNKPTIAYRIEGFCFFYVNTWELLTKARIIESANSR